MTNTVTIAIGKILPPENNMRYPLSNMSAEFNFMLRQLMEDDLYSRDTHQNHDNARYGGGKMTNCQTRLIALSIICSGIAASGHYVLGAVAYGF